MKQADEIRQYIAKVEIEHRAQGKEADKPGTSVKTFIDRVIKPQKEAVLSKFEEASESVVTSGTFVDKKVKYPEPMPEISKQRLQTMRMAIADEEKEKKTIQHRIEQLEQQIARTKEKIRAKK